MTPAYTCVIRGPGQELAVYWGSRLGYVIDPARQSDEQREAFALDLGRRFLAPRREALQRYAAAWPECA
jgi:hypothetical protein